MTNFVAMAYTKKQRQDIFTEQTPFSQNLCIFAPNKILMIKHDKRNYRKHSDRNKELINKSLSEVGAGRSILIDNENEIIAGNGVFEQWGDKPIKIIESDGSELIVVKRTDLSTEDPKRKQLAIMDNSASDSSEFDLELLCEDFESFELENMGVDIGGFDFDSDEYGEDFSLKDGDKAPFQQMTFTLADEQAEQIKNAISDIKQTDEYKYAETMGNENSNGNALYLIVMQWAEQRK